MRRKTEISQKVFDYLEISFGNQKIRFWDLETFKARINPIPNKISITIIITITITTLSSRASLSRMFQCVWSRWCSLRTGRMSTWPWTESSEGQQSRPGTSRPAPGMLTPLRPPSGWSVWRWGESGCSWRWPGGTPGTSHSLRRRTRWTHWRTCRWAGADF